MVLSITVNVTSAFDLDGNEIDTEEARTIAGTNGLDDIRDAIQKALENLEVDISYGASEASDVWFCTIDGDLS